MEHVMLQLPPKCRQIEEFRWRDLICLQQRLSLSRRPLMKELLLKMFLQKISMSLTVTRWYSVSIDMHNENVLSNCFISHFMPLLCLLLKSTISWNFVSLYIKVIQNGRGWLQPRNSKLFYRMFSHKNLNLLIEMWVWTCDSRALSFMCKTIVLVIYIYLAVQVWYSAYNYCVV